MRRLGAKLLFGTWLFIVCICLLGWALSMKACICYRTTGNAIVILNGGVLEVGTGSVDWGEGIENWSPPAVGWYAGPSLGGWGFEVPEIWAHPSGKGSVLAMPLWVLVVLSGALIGSFVGIRKRALRNQVRE